MCVYGLAKRAPICSLVGATPAFIAAANGQVEALRVLHELGADMDQPTKDGASPAFIAAQEGKTEALIGAPARLIPLSLLPLSPPLPPRLS